DPITERTTDNGGHCFFEAGRHSSANDELMLTVRAVTRQMPVRGGGVGELTLEEGYMSDRIIVGTFDNTNAAYDAATALKALKDKGVVDFKPKAGVMVAKDAKGNLSLLESKDRPLWGTGIGVVAGALIGLIGGAPGAAMGAAIGAT